MGSSGMALPRNAKKVGDDCSIKKELLAALNRNNPNSKDMIERIGTTIEGMNMTSIYTKHGVVRYVENILYKTISFMNGQLLRGGKSPMCVYRKYLDKSEKVWESVLFCHLRQSCFFRAEHNGTAFENIKTKLQNDELELLLEEIEHAYGKGCAPAEHPIGSIDISQKLREKYAGERSGYKATVLKFFSEFKRKRQLLLLRTNDRSVVKMHMLHIISYMSTIDFSPGLRYCDHDTRILVNDVLKSVLANFIRVVDGDAKAQNISPAQYIKAFQQILTKDEILNMKDGILDTKY